MPNLTRWYIRSALIYLVIALILAVFLALPGSIQLPQCLRAMTPVYFHLFLVGWVTQLIFGVIYWMFPIIDRENPYGNELFNWACYILLNTGLLLRLFAEPAVSLSPESGAGWLLAVSAVLQWFAGVLFVVLSWPRVKGRKR